MIVRSRDEIESLLTTPAIYSLSERLALAVEHYLSGTDPNRQHKARQELPYLIQFLPILARYRSQLPAIQAVNPGIPHGGLTEYPKSLIYDYIPDQFRIHTVDVLQDEVPNLDDVLVSIADLQRPLMLKADQGERGAGIYFLSDEQALRAHRDNLSNGSIERHPSSFQEFVSADQEYCLQFYHYIDMDDQEQREFGGLTLRDIPQAIGDGVSTVRELITALPIDEQHKLNIISKMETTESDTLESIPTVDDKVTIVRTASLDYGTAYRPIDLDDDQQTQILDVIKQLLTNIDTDMICVGRFDLKADSLEDLLAGTCKVIELNAGGGIPTHVYDEGLTIQRKYHILTDHFDHMIQIARCNQHHGYQLNTSYTPLMQASRRSIRKKGLTGRDRGSRRVVSIMRYVSALLQRMRRKRKKKQFLGYIGR